VTIKIKLNCKERRFVQQDNAKCYRKVQCHLVCCWPKCNLGSVRLRRDFQRQKEKITQRAAGCRRAREAKSVSPYLTSTRKAAENGRTFQSLRITVNKWSASLKSVAAGFTCVGWREGARGEVLFFTSASPPARGGDLALGLAAAAVPVVVAAVE
jgi:hypothetical protein